MLKCNTLRLRFLLLDEYSLKSMIEGVERTFGSWNNSLRFYIGAFLGAGLAEKIKRTSSIMDEDVFYIMRRVYSENGWGNLEVITIDTIREVIEIYLKDSIEGSISNNGCHMTRGHIAGFLSTILNTSVSVEEVECISKGAPYCKFLIKIQNFRKG